MRCHLLVVAQAFLQQSDCTPGQQKEGSSGFAQASPLSRYKSLDAQQPAVHRIFSGRPSGPTRAVHGLGKQTVRSGLVTSLRGLSVQGKRCGNHRVPPCSLFLAAHLRGHHKARAPPNPLPHDWFDCSSSMLVRPSGRRKALSFTSWRPEQA